MLNIKRLRIFGVALRVLYPGVTLMLRFERLKKYCTHSVWKNENAVFSIFGFVSAQLQGFANLRLRQSLAKNQKSSRRIGYSISLTALGLLLSLGVALSMQAGPTNS